MRVTIAICNQKADSGADADGVDNDFRQLLEWY